MLHSKIGVFVVDDSALIRKSVSEVLKGEADVVVVGTAPNGKVLLEKLDQLNPDVILLDLEMPEMDGLTALKLLRERNRDLPVVVFSMQTERGAQITLDALTAGANDYLCKPSGPGGYAKSAALIRNTLVPKLRALVQRRREMMHPPVAASSAPARRAAQPVPVSSSPIAAIAIGISAGGPAALATVVPKIPADIGVPLLLVQHMPPTFTKLLAERLANTSQLRVLEAESGMPVEPGTLYVARGDHHLQLTRYGGRVCITLDMGRPENGCRPAVDPLFRSAAAIYGSELLAVVMTGMGTDGTLGAEQVRQAGGRVWAQDQASSTIWGMAGSVVRAGLPERIFKLDELPEALVRAVKRYRNGASQLPEVKARA